MEQLEFGLGTPYYYIFLAVSCLIGRALSLAYLRFFRGKRLLIGDTTARSLVIVSFFFIVLSFADDLLVTKLDFDIETATSLMRLSGLFLSMWGDYLLETIINFPTLMSSIYKAICIKLDKEYKEEENPFNTDNPHKEEHKELLNKISDTILAIEDCLIEYREKKDDNIILNSYRNIAPDYVKICFEYEYIPSSEVESTLESQMRVLDTAYKIIIDRRDEIITYREQNADRNRGE